MKTIIVTITENEDDCTAVCKTPGHGIYDTDLGPCPLCNQGNEEKNEDDNNLSRRGWFS
jgi:hypothetical protein